jgi:hypothetical protein
MPEKIERPETVNIANSERAKEERNIVREVETIKENNEAGKTHLLQKIYKEGKVASIKSEFSEVKSTTEENVINKFAKEFYSIGSKAIGKARKVLGAYGLDRLHDEITNKNKSNK